MKKIIIAIILLESIMFFNPSNFLNNTSYANNQQELQQRSMDQNEIINTQKDNLKISDFMDEAQKYTKESMPGVNLNDLLSTAISGGVDNVKLMKLFFSLFRKRSVKFSRNFKQYNSNSHNPFNIKNNK